MRKVRGTLEEEYGTEFVFELPDIDNKFKEVNGWLFTEEQVKVMEGDYVFKSVHTGQDDGDAGIVWVRVVEKIEHVKVTNWSGERQEDFVAMTKEVLFDNLGRCILLNVAHGRRSSPNTDPSKFKVHIYSAPEVSESHRAHTHMWDIHVSNRDGVRPDTTRHQIYCDEGVPVASVDSNNLYIYHDVVHYGDDKEKAIYRRIMEETLVAFKNDFKQPPDLNRRIYIKMCNQRIKNELRDIEAASEKSSEIIANTQKKLVEAIREQDYQRHRMEELKKAEGYNDSHFDDEFSKLCDIAHVKNVKIQPDAIYFETDMVTCVDPRSGKQHNIGEFQIAIEPSSGDVKFMNQSYIIPGYHSEGMQAPHVFHNGSPCLGNMQNILPDLIAKFDFPSAAMIAVNFLAEVNTDDEAGQYIHKWPLSDEGEEEEYVDQNGERRILEPNLKVSF
jgi:hypothetical protein